MAMVINGIFIKSTNLKSDTVGSLPVLSNFHAVRAALTHERPKAMICHGRKVTFYN